MTWSHRLIGLLLGCLVFTAGLRSIAQQERPCSGRAHTLKVSDNRRFLVQSNGKPFFYLGDTAWELFHRLKREEAEFYLRDRQSRGFTVIQAVVLAELDGLREPNAYGQLPLKDQDPTQPNEAYFEHVDWIVRRAGELGLTIGMLPTWGDKWNKKWGVGPEIFTPTNAEAYGAWLGKRYKESAIIWILGGDRPVETDRHKEIVRAMARGLRRGDGGAHLMTFHPPGGSNSARWFHKEDWLDFNMLQNGHGIEFSRYTPTREVLALVPPKPALDGEPIYEDHPVAFKSREQGHSVAADVRRALYWDLFSGACGHTYGHHSVWQMFDRGRKPVNDPLLTWREALKQPGADQMRHGRALIESRPMLTRISDDALIVDDTVLTAVPGAGTRRFVACRDSERSYAMVYVPVGRRFTVRLDRIQGPKQRVWWFNPRDGQAKYEGELVARGMHTFTSPNPGELQDWVLVLDEAARNFPPPGKLFRE